VGRMKLKIPINPNLPLKKLNRIAQFEGIDIEIHKGKAYTTIEIIKTIIS